MLYNPVHQRKYWLTWTNEFHLMQLTPPSYNTDFTFLCSTTIFSDTDFGHILEMHDFMWQIRSQRGVLCEASISTKQAGHLPEDHVRCKNLTYEIYLFTLLVQRTCQILWICEIQESYISFMKAGNYTKKKQQQLIIHVWSQVLI